MKSISTLGTYYINEHPQLHLEVGELFDSYTNAQDTTFTKSTYSSLTQVANGLTIRHTCTQKRHM